MNTLEIILIIVLFLLEQLFMPLLVNAVSPYFENFFGDFVELLKKTTFLLDKFDCV